MAALGPYKFIIWHSGHACFELVGFPKQNYTACDLKTVGMAKSRPRNKEKTNQNAWFYLFTTLVPHVTLRPPDYYNHFILAWKYLCQSFSYLKNSFNTNTPLIRPIVHGPKVVVLTGFQFAM